MNHLTELETNGLKQAGRADIRSAVEHVARSLLQPAGSSGNGGPRRYVRTAEAVYVVIGHSVRLDDGRETAVVTIEQRPPELPPDEELRETFGITNRENQVARLLARGYPNERIAAELEISPHTARHHTQHILKKLGITSRTRVAKRLWEGCRVESRKGHADGETVAKPVTSHNGAPPGPGRAGSWCL